MHVATNIRELNQVRKQVLLSCLDFTLIFAELRRNVIELQRSIDFLFGCASDVSAVCNSCKRVLTQRIAHL